jgi:hypothetical protein
VAFAATATPGRYAGTLDISAAGPGQHLIRVEVASGGHIGSDVSAFVIGAPVQPGTVHVPSIAYTTSTGGGRGNNKKSSGIYITVSTVDGQGAPVANATVAVIVHLDGAPWAFAQGATNAQGQVTFASSSAPHGDYYTQIWAVSAGSLVWDGATPPNGFTK